jgi:hypothetical protein
MTLRTSRQGVNVLVYGDGDLRVSRQGVNVLTSGGGDLRVTQHIVEVMYEWSTIFVESNLSLTASSTGERNTSPPGIASNTMQIIDEATIRGPSYQNVVTEITTGSWKTIPIYDSDGNFKEYVSIPSGLSQYATIDGSFNEPSAGSFIGVTSSVSYLNIPAVGTDKSASNTISWTSTVYDSLGASNTISTSHTATGLGSTGADHGDLSLTQSASYSIEGTRPVTSIIGIEHAVSYYIVTDDYCDYEINIGSTDSTGLPSEPVEPTIIPVDRISFAHPYDSPTTTLYFNQPEWGNIHEIFQRRIDRTSRGGKRIVYRDSSWRKHEVIKITLTALTEAETTDLMTFFTNSAGTPVLYTDYESREWTVIMLNPDEQIVRDKSGNTVSIEMETV